MRMRLELLFIGLIRDGRRVDGGLSERDEMSSESESESSEH